jgi:hypothetical protein
VRIPALVALLLLVLMPWIVGSSKGAHVTTLPEFPFTPGTKWTYRYTRTPPGGPPSTGAATEIYGGMTSYRGAMYHFEDATDTLTPGPTARLYFTWNPSDKVAIQRAVVWTGPSSDPRTYELVFGGDGIVSFGAARATSGVAQCFFNREDSGTVAWSASSTRAGTVTIKVPAGTFTTTRWNWLVTFSGRCLTLSTTASGFVIGNVAVRTDEANSGLGTESHELQSGPVPKAEARPQQVSESPIRVLVW